MDKIILNESGLHVVIEITDSGDVQLLHFSACPYTESEIKGEEQKPKFRLYEVQLAGENHDGHHGAKHIETLPGKRLTYYSHRLLQNEIGTLLELVSVDPESKLKLTAFLQFYDQLPIARSWCRVDNEGDKPLDLEYVSSFALNGLGKEGSQSWGSKMRIHLPHNSWYGELQWRDYSLPDLGLSPVNRFTTKRISVTNTGSWSSSEYLPMGCLENHETDSSLFWQIEHNGSWHWEMGDHFHRTIDDAGTDEGHLYLRISGPTERDNQWFKRLLPGESFESVMVAAGSTYGGLEQASQHLTSYRRVIRREHEDLQKLPVIFNDFMNCLFGDPTSEKLYPLIDAAAEAGCEVYCIDAGWYADGEWWDGVGEWLPSTRRFPEGIETILSYIRDKGMVPGLWLEIEVMGVNCRLAEKLPDDWFFCRHGKRAIDNGRYQLDFRNADVRAYANSIVDRLVIEYGAGYIKMDYNINIGAGTELGADSFGDGLLGHNRAYLKWMDELFDRYPALVIEHCSSGGMRMDYAMLQRHSITSVTDQTDARKMSVIAAASPTAVTPEQAAIWSYPLENGNAEETIWNMVNAMLLRIHQSGHLANLDDYRKSLIREGISYYKEIRSDITASVPFWPLGMPHFENGWVSFGLSCPGKTYLAVWRLDDEEDEVSLPIRHLVGKTVEVRCAYPSQSEVEQKWVSEEASLLVRMDQTYRARLFEFTVL